MARILTKAGLKKLQDEFEDRKTRLRQEIAQAIKEAKEQGDLSENAEYTEAKQQQNENEARIAEIDAMIKDSVVAERHTGATGIQIGSRIKIKTGALEMMFEIVGSNEVNPSAGKISNESPLGQAFLGRSQGEKVKVETPSGKMEYHILQVV